MADAIIPLDLRNPGQVFACLGFLEAADWLCDGAEGGFRWTHPSDADAAFLLHTAGEENPVAVVLEYLAAAEVAPVAPEGWEPKKPPAGLLTRPGATTADPSETALPVQLGGGNLRPVVLGHWADGSGRESFKLYSGNRSAADIMTHMLHGKVTGKRGAIEQRGLRQMWDDDRDTLLADPLGLTVPLGGSFNFDARRASSSLDIGYSPDAQDQKVHGSPVVEVLAAWGLEAARPAATEDRNIYRYFVWEPALPPLIARAALSAPLPGIRCQSFRVALGAAGKNKIVTFAHEETTR